MTAALKIQKYLMDAPSILVAWLQPKLAAVSSNPWNECVAPTLSVLQLKNLRGTTLGALDFNNLVAVMTFRPTWIKLQKKFNLDGAIYDSAIKARGVRNKYSHPTANAIPSDAEQAIDCAKLERFFRAIGVPDSKLADAESVYVESTLARSAEVYAEIGSVYRDEKMSLNDKVIAYARIMFSLVKEAVISDPTLRGLDQSEARVRMRPLMIKLFASNPELHKYVVRLQGLNLRLIRADKDIRVSTIDSLEAFKTVCETACFLLSVAIPSELAEVCSRITYRGNRGYEGDGLELKALRAFITKVERPYLYVRRELADDSEQELKFNFLESGVAYGKLDGLVEPGMLLAFVTPSQSPTGEGLIASEIVIEPDYLVSPSALGNSLTARANPWWYYFISGFTGSKMDPKYALRGNVVSRALACTCAGRDVEYEKIREEHFKANPLEFLVTATGNGWEADVGNGCKNVRNFVNGALKTQQLVPVEKWQIEAPFVSPIYGMTGRADALCYDSPTTVLELKSGKWDKIWDPMARTFRMSWKQTHECQPLFYADILYSSLGIDFRNETSLIYYSSGSSYHAQVPHNKDRIQRWTQVRNRVVSTLFKFRRGTAQAILEDLSGDDFKFEWQSSKQEVEDILYPIANADSLAKSYFRRFLAFAAAEELEGSIGERGNEDGRGGESCAWRLGLNARVAAGLTFLGRDVVLVTDGGMVTGMSIQISPEVENSVCSIRKGDRVYVYRVKDNRSSVVNSILFMATVDSAGADDMILTLTDPQREGLLAFTRENGVRVAVEKAPRGGDLSYFKGAYALIAGNPRRRDLALFEIEPESDASARLPARPSSRYDNITDVLVRMWQARDFFLVWGVPGSGKTNNFMRAVVDQVMADPRCGNILLLAYTNRAADEICGMLETRIREEFPKDEYLRIGNPARAEIGVDRFPNKMNFPDEETAREKMESIRIVVSTVASMGPGNPIFKLKKFDIAVVDEASQLLEPHLMPLFCAKSAENEDIPLIGKFVFIGDDMQLPAVVQQDEGASKIIDDDLREIGLTDCRKSFFERLKSRYGKNPAVCGMLHAQFRMHPMISDFVNVYFYARQLTVGGAAHQSADALLPGGGEDPFEKYILSRHIGFLPVRATGLSRMAKANPEEAAVCARIVRTQIAKGGRQAADIGVIVPFKMQIAVLRQKLKETLADVLPEKDFRDGILIDTVERFEGSQRKVIVFSTVIGSLGQRDMLSATAYEDDDGDPDNIPVDRKLNVAVTRTREQFFLVGNENVLRELRAYGELVRYIRNKSGALSI